MSPRLGLSYDLFGDGRTAVKTSLGRYMALQQSDFAFNNTPANQQVLLVTRTWDDSFYPVGDPRNGNFGPDCDLKSTVGNAECGDMSNSKFGTVVPTEIYDRSVLDDNRGYSWQYSASVQHELHPGFGLNVAFSAGVRSR